MKPPRAHDRNDGPADIRAAREALQEREARLNSILETAQDAIIVIDERGIMESYSPAAERLFGGTGAWPQRQHAHAVTLSRAARFLPRALPEDRRTADHRDRPRRGRPASGWQHLSHGAGGRRGEGQWTARLHRLHPRPYGAAADGEPPARTPVGTAARVAL